ncbi:MAG: S-layer homology domain-containing protein [Oscillospiraceae bacterium]|nr:S-layer homology domain-containing protein [Oscillospiraceae bacterium]
MKKLTLTLLALMLAAGLGSLAASPASAASASLPAAVDNVYTLTEDVALPETAVFDGTSYTLDLNGYTLSGPDGGTVIKLQNGASLTVQDSSEAKSGKISASGKESTGISVLGSTNTLRMVSGTVSANGTWSVAVKVIGDPSPVQYSSNAIQLRGASVTAGGESANALAVTGSGSFVTLTRGSVSVTGDYTVAVSFSGDGDGGNQLTLVNPTVSAGGSEAVAILSDSTGFAKGTSIMVMGGEITAAGTRATAVGLLGGNDFECSGGSITAENVAITVNATDTVKLTGGTVSGATGVSVASGEGGSVTFSEGLSGDVPTVHGTTAAVNAVSNYTWRRTTTEPAMITISAGYFDGPVIGGDFSETSEDLFTYYDITGGYFTAEPASSAFYNYAVAKGLKPSQYTDTVKAEGKNLLVPADETHDRTTYPWTITDDPNVGYVLMNIPYADFYKAELGENDAAVDAVTSATRSKPRTGTLAGGSYHVSAEGTDITGVTYPVFVTDLSKLDASKRITDASRVEITVTNRGTQTTTAYEGKDALFEAASYAWYALSEKPARYKTLTVGESGAFSFSAVSGRAGAVEGVTGTVSYNTHHGNFVEINLGTVNGVNNTDEAGKDTNPAVSAVVVTFADGSKMGLPHIKGIWRKTQIGWPDASAMAGKTITNVTFITANGVYSCAVEIPVKLNSETALAARFTDASTLALTGLPADIANPQVSVQTKAGRGETATVIADKAAVADGKAATAQPAENGKTYTVTVTSDNYADLSAEAEYSVFGGIMKDIAGAEGTTYVNLFAVILREDRAATWNDYVAAVVGADNAAETVKALQTAISSDKYGEEAIAVYGDGSNGAAFDCWYINGAESFTFKDDTVTVQKDDGTSETHTYRYLGQYQIGEGETMTYNGQQISVAFPCDVYQSTDEAGEFNYFFLRDDTMQTTYHIEFRYGKDLKELQGYFVGPYAYWLSAGIDKDADEATIENVIKLFCLENMDYSAHTASALSQLRTLGFTGTWTADLSAYPEYAGIKLSFTIDSSGHGVTTMNGEKTADFEAYAYDNGTAGDGKGIYVAYSNLEFEAEGVHYEMTTNAAGRRVLTLHSEEGDISYVKDVAVISGGGSGSSGSSSGGSSGSTANTGSSTANADGSVTVTETRADGTTVKTTTYADGAETVTETKPDGSSVTKATGADGSTGAVSLHADGTLAAAEASISEKALRSAQSSGKPISVPITVPAAASVDSAVTIRVTMPDFESDETAGIAALPEVEIEVEHSGPGTVAYVKEKDGTMTLIKECRTGSVIVPVTGSCELAIVDNTKSFSDVSRTHWANESIAYVTAREIFNGVGNGLFAPESTMNRAMIAQMLYNYDRNSEAGSRSGFADIDPAAWYADAIGWASLLNYVNGYGQSYGASDPVTRQDLVTILYRYAEKNGYNVSGNASLDTYSDAKSVSDYARAAMEWAVGSGIINGMDDGTLSPMESATRAQVSAMMMRFIEQR